MTKKEKFLALVSQKESKTLEKNRERIRNRAKIREAQQTAIKILKQQDELH